MFGWVSVRTAPEGPPLFCTFSVPNAVRRCEQDICRGAIELDTKMSKEFRFRRAFKGKTPMNSASSILTKCPEHLISSEDKNGRRMYELAFKFNDYEDAILKYESWKVKLRENHWPKKWKEWNAKRERETPEGYASAEGPGRGGLPGPHRALCTRLCEKSPVFHHQ